MTSRFYWDPVSSLTLVGSASVSIVTGTDQTSNNVEMKLTATDCL